MRKNVARFAALFLFSIASLAASFAQDITVSAPFGHTDTIETIAFDDSGRLVVTASKDGTARIWNARAGREIRTLAGHDDALRDAVFMPGSSNVATISWDSTIRIWEGETGRQLASAKPAEQPQRVFASKDGTLLAVHLEGGSTRVWTSDLERIVGTIGNVRPAGFSTGSAGAPVVVGAQDSRVVARSASGGTGTRVIGDHGETIADIAVSADGEHVVTRSSNLTKMWRIRDGKLLWSEQIGMPFDGNSAFFGGDAVFLVDDSFSLSVTAFEVESGRRIRTVVRGGEMPTALAVSPSGDLLLGADFYGDDFMVDLAAGSQDVTIYGDEPNPFPSGIIRNGDVSFAPDGARLAVAADDGNAYVWTLQTGERLPPLSGHRNLVDSVAFNSDGSKLLTASWSGVAMLWDVDAQTPIRRFEGIANEWMTNAVFARNDSRVVTFQSAANGIILWDAATGQKLAQSTGEPGLGPTYDTKTGGFATYERSGPFGRESTTVWLHDTADLAKAIRDPVGTRTIGIFDKEYTAYHLAFSPDGAHVAVHGDNGTHVWSTEGNLGKNDPLFASDTRWWHRAVGFSPDSADLLIGADDHSISLWDWADNRRVKTFAGHGGIVTSLDYRPDGAVFASTSTDGTTRLWDVATGRERAQFVSFSDGSWVVMTPEGFFNASEDGARHINVVRGLEAISVDQVYDALFRPDLVREALAGDPDGKVAAAAAELDLDKVVESGFPPRLRLISPSDGASLKGEAAGSGMLDVEVGAEAGSGGVGKVEWFVNGVLQDLDSRGFGRVDTAAQVAPAPAKASGESEKLSASLPLAPGENTIQVIAYNAAGLIASEPLTFTVTYDAQQISDPKLFVLAVGVNDYFDSRLDLAYAASDARAIGAAFELAGRDIYADIVVETLLDDQVTRDGLEAAFEDLSDKVRSGDVFVLFLAGHGKTEDGRYYFIPHDFRYRDETSFETAGIGQATLQDWLSRIRAQKSVLLFDTCESGSLTGDGALAARGTEQLAAIGRLNRAVGRTTLTASTATTPALEGFRGHGIFTYTLLDAIAHADGNADSAVDVTELAGYLDRRLPELSQAAFGFTQVPQMKLVGNSFPLARATAVLDEAAAALVIASEPTHVIIQPADVLAEAQEGGARVVALAPGSAVRLLRSENGWSLIARDGKEIGYVHDAVLARIQ